MQLCMHVQQRLAQIRHAPHFFVAGRTIERDLASEGLSKCRDDEPALFDVGGLHQTQVPAWKSSWTGEERNDARVRQGGARYQAVGRKPCAIEQLKNLASNSIARLRDIHERCRLWFLIQGTLPLIGCRSGDKR